VAVALYIHIARIDFVRFRLTWEAGYGLFAIKGGYERTKILRADRGRRA
jgi:hypothetical protein